MSEISTNKPRHKILCQRKFYRYVVACMYNCREPHFCGEFWEFFRNIGCTPEEYFNEDGIGEAAMRRVVFDCDRCGKKDVQPVLGIFGPEGEEEQYMLSPESFAEGCKTMGYKDPLSASLLRLVLGEIWKAKNWMHFCDRCFKKMLDDINSLAMIKTGSSSPKSKAPKPPKASQASGGSASSSAKTEEKKTLPL